MTTRRKLSIGVGLTPGVLATIGVVELIAHRSKRQEAASIRMVADRSLATRAARGQIDRARTLAAAELGALDGKAFAIDASWAEISASPSPRSPR